MGTSSISYLKSLFPMVFTINLKKYSLLLLLVFAFALRLWGIVSRPIWYDEAFSILFSRQGPVEVLKETLVHNEGTSAAEEHPPLYYFGLWGWFQIFGSSVVVARMFSVFISILVIWLVYQITLELFDPVVALYSAGLASILPFQIHYAQEIRMYGLLSLWLLLATYAFLRARKGTWKWWNIFAAASVLAQYTHNLAAFYLIPLSITPLIQRDWKTLRSLILAGIGASILYLPWLIQLPSQFSKVSTAFWIERPTVGSFFTLFLLYLPHLPLMDVLLVAGLALAVTIIALTVFQTYLAWKNKNPAIYRGVWVAYLAFMPPLLLWLVSQIVPIYIERSFLPAHAMFCIWLAWALIQTRMPRPIQILLGGFIVVAALIGIYQDITYAGFPYGPYADINASIESRMLPGDVIIHSSKLSYLPAFTYDPSLPQGFIIDPPGSNVDTLAPAIREAFHLKEYPNIEGAASGAERVWFIIFNQSIEEYTSAGQSTHPHLEYLNANFNLISIEDWDDLQVYLYSK